MLERVLLTGASGFVGQPLLRALLDRGLQVDAVTRSPHPPRIAGVTWHQVDLLDLNAQTALLEQLRPTHLVHAAWYVEHGVFWHADANDDWLAASKHLSDVFVTTGGQRLLGVGTCAEYAAFDTNDETPWPETRRLASSTPYGRAKLALFEHLQSLTATHPQVQTAWARLFMLFGPGEQAPRLVPSVLNALSAGEPALCGSGRPVRDFVSTWWAAQAMAALLCSDVTGAVNVCSGQGVRTGDVSRQLARLLGREDLLKWGARPDPLHDIPVMVGDPHRLRTEVGFTDAFDLVNDLQRLVAAHKKPMDTQGTKAITNSASSKAPR